MKSKFGSKKHMLFVLHQAYNSQRRLSKKDGYLLGQNLSKYWGIKE